MVDDDDDDDDDDRLKRNQQTNSKFLLNYFLVNNFITLEEF
jgi:hypothetical protein